MQHRYIVVEQSPVEMPRRPVFACYACDRCGKTWLKAPAPGTEESCFAAAGIQLRIASVVWGLVPGAGRRAQGRTMPRMTITAEVLSNMPLSELLADMPPMEVLRVEESPSATTVWFTSPSVPYGWERVAPTWWPRAPEEPRAFKGWRNCAVGAQSPKEAACIPARTLEALDRYLTSRLRPGGFLTAVLQNDLRGAVMAADSENLASLTALVRLLHAEVDGMAWGSRAAVEEYLHPHAQPLRAVP